MMANDERAGSPNLELSHEHGKNEDTIFEQSSTKPELKNHQTKALKKQEVPWKAPEVGKEHATELHALTITSTDHILLKTAQASRLSNELKHSDVTKVSGESNDSDVTKVSGEDIEAPGPIVPPTRKHPKKLRGRARKIKALTQHRHAICKAQEIEKEHATELHALTITSTDHNQPNPAQASRLTNSELKNSDVTKVSGESNDSDVTKVSGEDIEAPGPIVPPQIPTPQQLHAEIEDVTIGTLLQILWRSNQTHYIHPARRGGVPVGTSPAVCEYAMQQLRELHRTLSENDYTRQPFPTRSEALRAARSLHHISEQEEIKDEIGDAEEAIEAEEDMRDNAAWNDGEFYPDFDEYVYYDCL